MKHQILILFSISITLVAGAQTTNDDVITWKRFLHYQPFCVGNPPHQSPEDSPHKGSLIQSLDVFIVVSLKEPLNKQSSCQWLVLAWLSYDITVMYSYSDVYGTVQDCGISCLLALIYHSIVLSHWVTWHSKLSIFSVFHGVCSLNCLYYIRKHKLLPHIPECFVYLYLIPLSQPCCQVRKFLPCISNSILPKEI